VGGFLDAPPVFLASPLDAVPAQRVWVFQVVGVLVALELDASGYLKPHGSGHPRPASNRVGRENGGKGSERLCAIPQSRCQKSVVDSCPPY
jgi:hypothetical protein